MIDERLIREIADPDFGQMQLWQIGTSGGPVGGPYREITLRDWRGVTGALPFSIAVGQDNNDFPELGPVLRKIIIDLPKRDVQVRSDVARQMIEIAIDWSEDESLTAADLASKLQVSQITIADGEDGSAVSIWLLAEDDTFTDHSVVAVLDARGEIDDVSLQG